MSNKDQDFEVWKRITNGDNLALKILFDSYYKELCVYALQFFHSLDDAEDVVQGIFISLWIKREEIEIQNRVRSYLYKSVYNACLQSLRTQTRARKDLEFFKLSMLYEQIDFDDTSLNEKIEHLKLLVDKLPLRCKEILFLSKKEGYKNREIAEKLNISIKTVEAQMSIALKKLREGFKNANSVLFILIS